MAKDERYMTFIVVPHGGRDLSTRSFEVSYRRLRLVGFLLLLATLAWLGMALSWAFVAGKAAQVPGLRAELSRLEAEQARVVQLAEALRRLESQYEQVRRMLGAERADDSAAVYLPPAGERPAEPARSELPPADTVAVGLPDLWPLASRGFITREHLEVDFGPHPGIDIAVPEGEGVWAAADGVVTAAGEDGVYGKYVRIRHRDGYETLYAHVSRLLVGLSDTVHRHQIIALTGNSGASTAPHLHFEVRKDGQAVDPQALAGPPHH